MFIYLSKQTGNFTYIKWIKSPMDFHMHLLYSNLPWIFKV